VVEHGSTGLLVPARDAAALTDAIARLAGDPALRATMGRNAVAKAIREFDQRRVIATTLDVYEGLLERKVRRGDSQR
jgi:glycosyltransferase involved in cell wall biosynthesis